MKKAAAGLAATLLLGLLAFAAPKPKSQSFTGEIMDSQCATAEAQK
jgi:type 1 fimbria pilin